jgi:DNA-binding NtrC family response regulator
MEKPKMLVLDDEDAILFTLSDLFNDYEVKTFSRPTEALDAINSGGHFDILLIDFRMHGLSGLDFLRRVKKLLKSYKAILITAYSTKEMCETAINEGLIDKLVNKPIEDSEFRLLVDEVIASLIREREDNDYNARLQKQISIFVNTSSDSQKVLIHSCKKMQEIFLKTKKYAASNANILIEGDSGVGKEVIANLIHSEGHRANKPLVKVNCSAIPEHLFESELFGYKKGAFTGAFNNKPGKFQLADGGCIFLDEIAELPIHQQAKLLRAIEDLEITPLGSIETEKVDVRVISATNKNLDELIKNGQFRSDLHFRLNILNIRIPPLNERKEDIPLLSTYFINEIANREGGIIKSFDKEALAYLTSLTFPGNIRELRSLIYSAYIESDDIIIRKFNIERLRRETSKNKITFLDKRLSLAELEREYILFQLKNYDFNLTETARAIGMERSNFSRKLKAMGIQNEAKSRDENKSRSANNVDFCEYQGSIDASAVADDLSTLS